VGVDRPEYDDLPTTEELEPELSRSSAVDGGAVRAETRDRATYYAELRAAVAAEYRGAADNQWDEAVSGLADRWAEHERRWPASSREPIDRSADEPGSWRGEGDRFLEAPANESVDRGCDRIQDIEENVLSPAMRRVEQQDPDRELVGFEYRLKGRDRIKEKVAVAIEERGRDPEEALATVKDPVRYTFLYPQDHYSSGVRADTDRLTASGFEMVEQKNSWANDEYKGINSRWRETGSGQLFEVQFHTRMSFEAKQATHGAYERIRDPLTSRAELREARNFQREVCDKVPVPPGATDIPDYP
jgi:hypothetical protein